jgi:hypothetical protein
MNTIKYYIGLASVYFVRLAVQARGERTCRKCGFRKVSLGDVKISGARGSPNSCEESSYTVEGVTHLTENLARARS